MAQKRFITHNSIIKSFEIGEARTGINRGGRYKGFNNMTSDGGLTVSFNHEARFSKTLVDGSGVSTFGALVMKTGIVVHEDAPIQMNLASNSGNANNRYDLLIAQHNYAEVQNGVPVTYSLIQGDNLGNVPVLSDPDKQIIIGTITAAPGANAFGAFNYEPAAIPLIGDLTSDELYDYILTNVVNQINTLVPNATESEVGKAALATAAEVLTGAVTNKIVTPATLHNKTATDSRIGLVRKATESESQGGVNTDTFITPSQLATAISNAAEAYASETKPGVSEIATVTEVLAGKDKVRFVTPFTLKQVIDSITGLPSGIITMWAGIIADIPQGWYLCDGAGGNTPNLSGKFIVGYDASDPDYEAVGQTGGEKQHVLTIDEMPSHNHDTTLVGQGGGSGGFTKNDGEVTPVDYPSDNAGGGQPHENRPPYYVLAYIQYLPNLVP